MIGMSGERRGQCGQSLPLRDSGGEVSYQALADFFKLLDRTRLSPSHPNRCGQQSSH